jgi:predicted CoA-binding protein
LIVTNARSRNADANPRGPEQALSASDRNPATLTKMRRNQPNAAKDRRLHFLEAIQKGVVMKTSRRSVDEFLAQPALALVGVSRSGKHFGNAALGDLLDKGYQIYPLHPAMDTVGGVKCYHHFHEMPNDVGGVIVVVPPPEAVSVVRDAAAAGIRRVWLQQGAESPYVLGVCHDLGLEVISGECILMFAKPTGVHKAHRWIAGLLHQLPA